MLIRQADKYGMSYPIRELTFQSHDAAMFTNNILADIETQAGPFTLRFGREERGKNLFLQLSRDSRAIIFDQQLKVAVPVDTGLQYHPAFTPV